MFTLILVIVIAFGALLCYASCAVSARADKVSEECCKLKEMENYYGRHFKDE